MLLSLYGGCVSLRIPLHGDVFVVITDLFKPYGKPGCFDIPYQAILFASSVPQHRAVRGPLCESVCTIIWLCVDGMVEDRIVVPIRECVVFI